MYAKFSKRDQTEQRDTRGVLAPPLPSHPPHNTSLPTWRGGGWGEGEMGRGWSMILQIRPTKRERGHIHNRGHKKVVGHLTDWEETRWREEGVEGWLAKHAPHLHFTPGTESPTRRGLQSQTSKYMYGEGEQKWRRTTDSEGI